MLNAGLLSVKFGLTGQLRMVLGMAAEVFEKCIRLDRRSVEDLGSKFFCIGGVKCLKFRVHGKQTSCSGYRSRTWLRVVSRGDRGYLLRWIELCHPTDNDIANLGA